MNRGYAEILFSAITESGLKLEKIAELIGRLTGSPPSREYISKLQNGKTSPAGDKLNDALAKVLDIDPVELKVAAYREKIPADVLEKLRADPRISTA